ncbi:MAG: LysR family transcriptional regulator [Oscillospiraceae bacterium]
MNLSQLYYFRKLAELQHYTQAAQELYITQPSLSGAIASLETELGIPLFEKRGRNVWLTKYGKEFYEYVCSSLQLLEQGVAIAKEHAGTLSGTIDIGSISTIQGDYLPMVIRSFLAEKGSGIKFSIHQEQTNEIVAALQSGKWDVGFCSPVEGSPDLFFVPVLSQPLVVVVNRDHALAHKKSLTFEQLKGYELLSYHTEQPIGKQINRLLEEKGLQADQQYSNEIDMSGVAAISDTVAVILQTPSLREFDSLVAIPLPEVSPDFRVVNMAFNHRAYKCHAVECFIDYVAAYWSYSSKSLGWQQFD